MLLGRALLPRQYATSPWLWQIDRAGVMGHNSLILWGKDELYTSFAGHVRDAAGGKSGARLRGVGGYESEAKAVPADIDGIMAVRGVCASESSQQRALHCDSA